MEHCGVLPTTQFAYRKGLGTCDVLLCVSHTLQSALEGRRPGLCRSTSALLLIGSTIREFSKLSSVGSGGSVLSVLTQFLFNRSQYVLVDGCSKLVNVASFGILFYSVVFGCRYTH